MMNFALPLLLLFPLAAAAQTSPETAPPSKPAQAHTTKTDAQGNPMMDRKQVEIGMPRLAPRFDEIDADKDGYLSRDEINSWHRMTHQGKAGMAMQRESKPGKGAKRDDIKDAAVMHMKRADRNGDGRLSREEAQAMPRIARDFDAIDANRDGQVTAREMRNYMHKLAKQRRKGAAAPAQPQ